MLCVLCCLHLYGQLLLAFLFHRILSVRVSFMLLYVLTCVLWNTRSQAAARIADRTAAQQTLVISNCGLIAYCTAHETPCSHLDMFPWLYRTTIRVNIALILAALSQLLCPFRKLVSPFLYLAFRRTRTRRSVGAYFEHVTANNIFILFLQISLTRVVIKMIINYFFVKFVTILTFVYFLSQSGNRMFRLTKHRPMLGAGQRTPTKSIEIVGATSTFREIICASARHSLYKTAHQI